LTSRFLDCRCELSAYAGLKALELGLLSQALVDENSREPVDRIAR
jgi:hypothetical protein